MYVYLDITEITIEAYAMESLNGNSTKSLYELNYGATMRNIPLLTYLLVMSLIGIVGNWLVLHILMNTYTPSTFRMFVILLSIVDLFICSVSIPLQMLTEIFKYNSNIWLCRGWAFFTAWPTTTSVFLLVAVAFDRYRKVCAIFAWQLSNRSAKIIFIVCASLSIVCSILTPVISSVEPSKHGVYNITIFRCETTEAMNKTPFPMIHTSIFALAFIGTSTGITIFYCCIAVRVKKQSKRRRKMLGIIITKSKAKVADKTAYKKENNKYDNETPTCRNTLEADSSDKYRKRKEEPLEANMNFKKTEHSHITRSGVSTRKHHTGNNKATFVMLLVTAAFFVSFLPSLFLNLISPVDKNNFESLTFFENSVYKLLIKAHFLSSVVNPFIYGVFDPHFRESCSLLCRRMGKK